jgi:uncharacterized membrane protein YfhO
MLCALLLLDLAYVHRGAVRHDDSKYEKIARIKKDLKVSFSGDNTLYRVGAFQHPLGPNLEMVLGYQTVGGFTALFPSRYYDYVDKYAEYRLPRGWVSFFYGPSRNPVLMDLLNVKYEISYTGKAIGLRNTCLPRAFIVPSAEVVAKEEILGRLTSPAFQPRDTVLIEEKTVGPKGSYEKPSAQTRVHVVDYAPDSILLQAESKSQSYLFLSEIFYPGWKALVDDQPEIILRGNYLFRVIPLPAGRHRVRLLFDPPTIKLGTGISAITALVVLGTLVRFFLRRKVPARR